MVRGLTPPRDVPRLVDFVKAGWHVVEPGKPIIWNWHLEAICEHLEAVRWGEIRNLLINIPPGHAKSVVVGVLWPAWMWLSWPEFRGLFSSYDQSLVSRDSERCRDVIESEWYQGEYAPNWRIKRGSNQKTYWTNTRKGFRFCHTVAGRGTGHRGDGVICDDPLNARHRHSIKKRQAASDWWFRTMPTRLNDPRIGFKVVIMQRLHEEDIAAQWLEKSKDSKDGIVHLNLMTRFVPERKTTTIVKDHKTGEDKLIYEDPRTERGELLFKELFTEEVINDLEADLGEDDFEAQHQQNPTPAEGGMFKKQDWRLWYWPDGPKPPEYHVKLKDGSLKALEMVPLSLVDMERIVLSWDLTFKEKRTSDWAVGQAWGVKEADRFLLHQVREQMGFDKSVEAFRQMELAYPNADAKYVEDKANGSAILDHLRSEIAGLIAVEPRGDKIERAHTMRPSHRGGNLYIPHPSIAAWVEGFIERFAQFPNGKDDEIDAASQALDQIKFEQKEAGATAILPSQRFAQSDRQE